MRENPIFAIAEQAAALSGRGIDVVTLAAGEPQVPTSAAILEAAHKALEDPATHHYGPAQGNQDLRAGVACALQKDTGLCWDAAAVQIALGAKHALYLAVKALTSPDDEVLVAAPGWPGHAAAVEAAGASAVGVACDEGFRLSVTELESARTSRTRALIVSSPSNPTGAVHDAQRLAEIAAWAQEHNLWYLSDDIYATFDYSGTYTSILRAVPKMRERTVLIGGVSKEHAMTGWRIGWLAGPEPIITAARKHVGQTITQVPNVTQQAAVAALEDTQTPHRAALVYRDRRDRLVAALDAIEGVNCPMPDGGMFAFPDISELLSARGWSSSAEFAQWLLHQAHVAVVPGEAFDAPGRLRVCFAVDDQTIETAVDRITRALHAIRNDSATTPAQRPDISGPELDQERR